MTWVNRAVRANPTDWADWVIKIENVITDSLTDQTNL